jgi:hypothetical protein
VSWSTGFSNSKGNGSFSPPITKNPTDEEQRHKQQTKRSTIIRVPLDDLDLLAIYIS